MRRSVCFRHASIDIMIICIPVVIGEKPARPRKVEGRWKESERDVQNEQGWRRVGYKFYAISFLFLCPIRCLTKHLDESEKNS